MSSRSGVVEVPVELGADLKLVTVSLQKQRSRPSHLLSLAGVFPAPSIGDSSDDDLGPAIQKKMFFMDEEVAHYRSLLGFAAATAAFTDGFSFEGERPYFVEYLDWISEWVTAGCDPLAYRRLCRRFESHRKRWDLRRKTLMAEFEAGEWEAIEELEVVTGMHARYGRESQGTTIREDPLVGEATGRGSDVDVGTVIPDSEGGDEGSVIPDSEEDQK